MIREAKTLKFYNVPWQSLSGYSTPDTVCSLFVRMVEHLSGRCLLIEYISGFKCYIIVIDCIMIIQLKNKGR